MWPYLGIVALWALLGPAFAAEVNLLWVNDAGNDIAKEAISIGLDNPPSGITIGAKEMLESANSDVVKGITELCAALDAMIDAGAPPDIIIDSTRAGIMADVVKTMTWTLGYPTLSTSYGEKGDIREWRDLTAEQANYLIQIRPPGDVITGIVRRLIHMQNITNAAILFDSSFVMDYKYKSLLLNIPVRHIIHMVKDTDAELRMQLKKIADVDLNNFFVLGSMETISRVMSAGNAMSLVGNKYAWFGLTKEVDGNLNCVGCNHDKLVMMPVNSPKNTVANLRRNYGLEGKPDIDAAFYYDTLMLGLKAVSDLKTAGEWPAIEYQKCNDYTQTDPIIRDVKLMQALTSTKATENFAPIMVSENGKSSPEFDVSINKFMFKGGSLASKQLIGTWNVGSPMNIMTSPGMSLGNVAAKTVYKVVTVVQPPFVMRDPDPNSKYGFKGYCIDLLEALSELMKFEVQVYEVPDGQYGSMTPDLKWNGVIKELVDRNADIAVGAISVMAERETVIDFTVPYYDLVGITIMMKKPKVPTSLFKFLTVLENSVWGCILAAYFFTSVLMWIFDKYSPYSYQNNMEKYKDDEEKRYFNFKECLWFCMTSLTPQGGGEAPKNLSGRLVAATWWLFGFIIIASYTANLAAFLTVSRLETPVESLEDLSKQYKIQYSPLNQSAAMVYFERMAYIEDKFYQIWKDMSLNDSTDEYERSKLAVWDYPVSDKYTKIWQSMREAGLPMTLEEAKKRVRDSPSSSEGYAFIGDATDIRYQVLTNCDLQMVGEEFSRKPYALAVQQGSPLKDQLNDAILKLLNQRKLETFKERWWNQNPEKVVCEDDGEDSGGGISIYNIGGVFIVIFVGIALAIVTLIIEYWYYKYKKPATNSDAVAKQLQVKQQVLNSTYAGKAEFGINYRGSNNPPAVENQW